MEVTAKTMLSKTGVSKAAKHHADLHQEHSTAFLKCHNEGKLAEAKEHKKQMKFHAMEYEKLKNVKDAPVPAKTIAVSAAVTKDTIKHALTIVNVLEDRPETVEALFGFGRSKFSKKMLPGATPETMQEFHDSAADHHRQMAHNANHEFMQAGTRAEKNAAFKQSKWHTRQADKHERLMNHFSKMGTDRDYKNARIPIQPQPMPARAAKPAPVAPANPVRTEPHFNNPGPHAQPAAPAPQAQHSPSAPPASEAAPAPHHMPQQQSATPTPAPSAPPPQHAAPVQPPARHNQPAPTINQHHNAPANRPAVAPAHANPISHYAAKMWHSVAPHVRHMFAKKNPQSPMAQSHLTGNPAMPIPHENLARMHAKQAQFHAEQAIKARNNAQAPDVTGVQKQQHMQQVNEHQHLANNHNQLSQNFNFKAAQAAKLEKARSQPMPTPVERPRNPTPPNTNINRRIQPPPPKPLEPLKRESYKPGFSPRPKQPNADQEPKEVRVKQSSPLLDAAKQSPYLNALKNGEKPSIHLNMKSPKPKKQVTPEQRAAQRQAAKDKANRAKEYARGFAAKSAPPKVRAINPATV